ncbi:MAG: hypothetical protein NC113_03545 [Bacteroides sp.]|nr:hypothetical protein [Bacteroides sp.]MCM1447284.1 hypothetical protein [Bacteroides sp.]
MNIYNDCFVERKEWKSLTLVTPSRIPVLDHNIVVDATILWPRTRPYYNYTIGADNTEATFVMA